MRRPKAIQKTTLVQGVTQEIVRFIQKGRLKPGDRLPSEKELMAQMGVGRSSVREAIQRLIHLEIVRSHPGQGTFVREIPTGVTVPSGDLLSLLTKDALGELIEVRICLETRAAYLAAQNATAKDIKELEETLKGVEGERERRSRFGLNAAFHLAVAKASHNRFLIKLVKDVVYALPRESEGVLYPRGDNRLRGMEIHGQICKAIEEGNPQKAQQWMSRHFEFVQEVLQRESCDEGRE